MNSVLQVAAVVAAGVASIGLAIGLEWLGLQGLMKMMRLLMRTPVLQPAPVPVPPPRLRHRLGR